MPANHSNSGRVCSLRIRRFPHAALTVPACGDSVRPLAGTFYVAASFAIVTLDTLKVQRRHQSAFDLENRHECDVSPTAAVSAR